jgi:MarR family transcriptional regulator, organic hydroperoxide resistance regulator
MTRKPVPGNGGTQAILRHWREAVPNDRLALQVRLAEHGVPFGHWTFLRILWETDGLTQSELSEQAGVMEPTTFAALKTMEKRGYITRRKSPNDGKKVFIHLTSAGRALKDKLVPLALDANRIAVSRTSAADIATTRRILLRMIENLAAEEAKADERPVGKPPRQRRRKRLF